MSLLFPAFSLAGLFFRREGKGGLGFSSDGGKLGCSLAFWRRRRPQGDHLPWHITGRAMAAPILRLQVRRGGAPGTSGIHDTLSLFPSPARRRWPQVSRQRCGGAEQGCGRPRRRAASPWPRSARRPAPLSPGSRSPRGKLSSGRALPSPEPPAGASARSAPGGPRSPGPPPSGGGEGKRGSPAARPGAPAPSRPPGLPFFGLGAARRGPESDLLPEKGCPGAEFGWLRGPPASRRLQGEGNNGALKVRVAGAPLCAQGE